jgi:hypothetical protein
MTFERWFETFLEEKEIDLSDSVMIADRKHTCQLGAVCSVINQCTASEKAGIKRH